MKLQYRAWFSLLCTLMLWIPIRSQTISLYSSRPVNVGARAAGFAEAYVTDAYDANSMYWNPAALVYLQRSSIVMNHSQERIINTMNENIAVPFQIRRGEAVAIGLTVNHVGYIESSPNFDFHVIQYGYDIVYSREVVPTVSVGAGLGVRYAKSTTASLWGVSSSMGVFYSPSQEISYGAVLSGIGSGILYASDRTTTSLSSENLPRSLQAGATLRFPPTFSQTFFTISVANEKVFGQDGIRYKGGMELFLFKVLALRGGYIVEPGLGSARFGFGIRTERFQLDYAISPSKQTDRAYHVSAAFTLWNRVEALPR
ncbi:MAG: hypothetical protein HYR76_04010 [Ignavibacteria bacterium]|nr:hypothetical protein [Ignavibacteria bacterium]